MMLIILGNLDLFFCKLLIIKIIQEKFSSFQNISFFLIYLESVNYNIIKNEMKFSFSIHVELLNKTL